jgi:hypothetical protein
MSFLPDKYEVPVSGGRYFKFMPGENNFRIISSAVIGYEYWDINDKPKRVHELPKKRPADIRLEKNGTFKIKHFWAFTVWNYEKSEVEIMEITQKTIMNAIKSIIDNPKWGDIKQYDITITKEGEGLNTEYAVMPNPKSELEPKILEEVNKSKVNLEALFTGGNPFEESEAVDTHDSTMSPEEQNEILNTIEVE